MVVRRRSSQHSERHRLLPVRRQPAIALGCALLALLLAGSGCIVPDAKVQWGKDSKSQMKRNPNSDDAMTEGQWDNANWDQAVWAP